MSHVKPENLPTSVAESVKKYNLKINIIPKCEFKKRANKNDGWYYPNNRTIEISDKLTQHELVGLLFHEFTHFVVDIITDPDVKYKSPSKKTIVISNSNCRKINKLEEKFCENIQDKAISEFLKFVKKLS